MSALICPSTLLGGVRLYILFSPRLLMDTFKLLEDYKRDIRQRLYGGGVFGRVSRSDDVLEVITSSWIFAAEGVAAISC